MLSNLFVLFDPACELCQRCKSWLQLQRQIVALTFIEAASADARNIFPLLDHSRTLSELTVVSDEGGVYTGAKAYVMCLWALADYRAWAATLATPELMPTARLFLTTVSENRKSISRLLAS
jgi:predicted DCC family thiol-disulfide oxidoreductase YuxK